MYLQKLKIFLEFIRIEHTIFSLFFAYVGAFLAIRGIPSFDKLLWVTLALFGARSAAIALSDVVDRDIDAKNPRTKNRHLPSGRITVSEAKSVILLSYLLLFISAYQLNFLCFVLSPVPVLVAVIYPYSKRFTWLAHIILGVNLGIAPIGGWIGITGGLDLPPFILALAVTLWVAGFDIIYACQDVEFDRKFGLHSIPAAFGIRNGLLFSLIFHVLTILLLFSAFFALRLGLFYLMGVVVIAMLLAYEHMIVSPEKLDKVLTAFFKINALISTSIFIFVLLDVFA